MFRQNAKGIAIISLQREWKQVNDKVCEILGYSEQELKGLTCLDVSYPDDTELDELFFKQLLAKDIDHFDIEKRLVKRDGTPIWVRLGVSSVFDHNGEIAYAICFIEDIQARKASDLQYADLRNNLPGAIFQYILHKDGSETILHMSPGCENIWEITPEQAETNSTQLWSVVLKEDIEGLAQSVQVSASKLEFWSHEWRIRTPSGRIRWLSGTGTPRRLDNGDTFWNSVIIDVTSERVNQHALDSFFEQLITLNIVVNLDGTIVRVNSMWERLLGYTRSEMEGQSFVDFIHPDDVLRTHTEYNRVKVNGHSTETFENRYRHKNGQYRLLSWSSVVSKSEGLVYAIATDITEKRQSEDKLLEAATILSSTIEGVMVTDTAATILEVNNAFTQITGYSEAEVIGKNVNILQSGLHDDDFYEDMWSQIKTKGAWQGEIWNQRKDGRVFPEILSISSILDEHGKPDRYVGVFSDISEITKHQQRLDFLAHYDELTNLPNRRLFENLLGKSINRCQHYNQSLALIYIDLDRFKHINDSMGHTAGDTVLVQTAKRLSQCLRESDTVARISGDEFVVIVEDIDSTERAATIANSILSTFNQPFTVNELEIYFTASMGITLYPQDGEDASVLMSNADAAMYQAKDDGRNTFQFYSAKYTSEAETFLFLASEMQKALEKEQFYLVYQPQFDMTNGHVIGIEALLRWPHPTRGLIPPDQFIPIAEKSGLIRQLGFWVMEQACQTARTWLDQGLSFGRMAVNVAGPQFHYKEFNREVTDILAKTHLPARCLELEVTESFVMKDAAEIPNKLNELKHMGISLSIDDFGTGYSSMSSLSQLPIDKLKIDKSFVADIPGNHNAEAMAEAIIAMARALQLNVVVEGVETREHINFFAKYGCEGQGYFYSKPIEAEACASLLRGSVESD